MSHRLVTIPKKKSNLGPGQSFEIAFRPGVAKNMSATADLSEDAQVELVMLDASGAVVARDQMSRAPFVNFQPTVVGDFRARVTNRSSIAIDVVLTAKYYTLEELRQERIEIAKVVAIVEHLFQNELRPHVRLEGQHLTVTGDPTLLSMLGKWSDCDLDLPVSIQGIDIDSKGFNVKFEPPSDGYPSGSIVLELHCPHQVTLKKAILASVGLTNPTFRLRIGVNVYAGIHLTNVVLELPPLEPNWLATIGEWAMKVLTEARAGISDAIVRAVQNLEDNGALVRVTQKIQKALQMQRLQDLRIDATHLVLEYEPLPTDRPVPKVTAAPKPRSPRLEHLVIVMLENRSFDHMMADIVRGRDDVRRAPDVHTETITDPNGKKRVFDRAKTRLHALLQDPPHDSKNQDHQAEGMFVRSFLDDHKGSPLGAEVLSYQPREHLPFFDFLAREFVICDDWRAALRGHTWPNRQYSLAGASKKTSKGYRDNPDMSEFEFYTQPTICDVLEAQGVDWAYYKDDFAFIELYRRWVFDRSRVRTRAQFDKAIATGTLPTVSWFEPNISDFGRSFGNDDHPPVSVYAGQRLLADLYKSLCKLPTSNWLLAITYDESGGFYDHLPAEDAPDDQPLAAKQGFRVPAFLVSPWLQKGKVCPQRFDHTSLIRTVLDNFCADEPIFINNKRVHSAHGFAEILDQGSKYATDTARTMPPFTDVIPDTVSLEMAGLEMAGAVEEIQPQHPLFTAFEAARQSLLADQATRRVPEPGLELAGLEALPPSPPPNVRFEGLYIETRVPFPELVALGWTTRPWFDNALEARPPAPLTVDIAWDLVHDLRTRHPKTVIDPLWETAFPYLEPDAKDPGLEIAGAPEDRRWHLKAVRAEAAWAISPKRGKGIVIGHLDTGYREHPDLDPMLLSAYGWDVYRDDSDPHDDMEDGFCKFPGHGTSTGSIIGSRGIRTEVMGIAPDVSTIPIRISASVIHMSMSNMVRGIQMAVERNVHVISLSAGGLWSAALHRAVRDAVDAGVIVVAAAGNYSAMVVWPARFDEVISCGAINANKKTWFWSNGRRGDHVTVMAPGEDVWVLRPKSRTEIAVTPGSGTSFATACVAGAIATWLAHHGRDKLIAKYGRANLARVAKQLVRALTEVGGSAGLLDMVNLLEAPLPDLGPTPAPSSIDPIAHGLESLQIAAANPAAPFADELAFRDTLAKLSQRSATPEPIPAISTVPPIDTLGSAVASIAVTESAAPIAVTVLAPRRVPMSARLELAQKGKP